MRLNVYLATATLAFFGCGGCAPGVDVPGRPLSQDQQQHITNDVRRFMQDVAHDVTQDGPMAWRKHFEDTPSFFMAVNGEMAFPDSQSATQGIQNVARTYKKINLQWGDDVRVDPLTPGLASVATAYHDFITLADDQHLDSKGFFTAVAENRAGQWQFLNVHWSVPAPLPGPTPGKSAAPSQ